MNGLTKTYLVTGRNQKTLLEKLKKGGVNLLKIEILSKNKAKITIDAKDAVKYFAICKNSWYNNLLRTSGVFNAFYLMVKNWVVTVSVILYFAVCFAANGLYFENEYQGDALLYRPIIEKQFEKAGVTKNRFFTQTTLNEVKKSLEKERGIAFISIEKKGNKALVYLKSEVEPPKSPLISYSDLIAEEDMVILNITVYSGTGVVEVGQAVKKGEVLAKASHLVKDEEVKTPLYCVVTAECAFEYIYRCSSPINDSVYLNGITSARFALGDYKVRSYTTQKISENQIKIILKYEKVLNGG